MKPGGVKQKRPTRMSQSQKNSVTFASLHRIPSGRSGTIYTLNVMRRLTRAGKKDIRIRELAFSLIKGLPSKDYYGQMLRLHEFVRDHINYVRDIRGVETVQEPIKTVEYEAGDCDDQAVLLAALLESIGHPTRFVALGFNGGPFSHVMSESRMSKGWIPLETTENVSAGWRPENVTSSYVVNN